MSGMHRLRIAAVLLIIAPLLFSLGGPPTDVTAQRADRDGRKVIVDNDDRETVAELTRRGATVLVDYGAFALWIVPEPEMAALRARPSVAVRDDLDTITLRGGQSIDTRAGAAPAAPAGLQQARTSDPQFWLVQFVGPIKEAWLDDLRAAGLELVIYMPQNAYVVWGDGAALERLDAYALKSPLVQFTGAYHPAYRLEPSLQETGRTRPATEPVSVTVQFYTTKDVGQSLARLRSLGGPVHREPSEVLTLTSISLDLPAGQLVAVANWADVFNVEPYVPPRRFDEAQGQIVAGNLTTSGANVVPIQASYLSWLDTKGFPTTQASYPVIDVTDDGIDNGTATPLHPDFFELGSTSKPHRLFYNHDCTADPSANAVGGHGNINAGIVGAYNNLIGSPHQDARGFRLDLGISPYGRLAGTKIFLNTGNFDISQCGGTVQGVVQASFANGATITSQSWGADVGGAYNADAQTYDALTRDASGATAGNQQMLHVFAAGNAGAGANTIGSPGTAKNVLTVGATENVRDDGIADGCGYGGGNNADDIATFSSRGPTDDSRVKPDIMAPGTHVQGAASRDAGYNGTGVCGAAGNFSSPHVPGTEFYPAGQTLYTWSSGTSHSTPAVAGAASLLYNYYGRVLAPGQTPSPSMLKALLLNSPRYLNGSGTGGTLPSNDQGWGDVNLGLLFDGTPRGLVDQSTLLTATGQGFQRAGTVSDVSKPFRVTLAWTDAPGSTTGNAFVNDLDLEVTIGGNTYKGNVFSGASSATGGGADIRNNVENIFLPAGATGAYSIRVIARNLAGNGVPGNVSALDQDFALVVYNGNLTPAPFLSKQGVTTGDAGGNNNSFAEPGEPISLTIAERNSGDATATGVSGSLALTGGSATITNGTSAYPNIAPTTAASNTAPYTFTVAPTQPCGSTLTFQHTVTYNGSLSSVDPISVPIGRFDVAPRNSSDVPKAIPDNNPTGVTVSLPVSGLSGTVVDVNVRLSLTHTWDADLLIQLVSPVGTIVTLSDRRGASGDNFTNTVFDDEAATAIAAGAAPFTGSFRPDTALSALDGQAINGTWQLKVSDLAGSDVGTVTAFGLDITPPAVCEPVTSQPDLTLTKTHTGNFTVGQNGTYTLTVANAGPGATTGAITVTDTLPAGLTFVSGTGTGWGCTASGQTVTCTRSTALAAGANTPITLTVGVALAAVPQVTNSATVSTAGESNTGNNGATDPTAVSCGTPRPNVGLAVTQTAPGQLQVVVTAGHGQIGTVQFKPSPARDARNASVTVPGAPTNPNVPGGGLANQTADFSVQANHSTLTFTVSRVAPGPYNVPLVVTDGCGPWNTFVGRGS